ncbi:MAG: hypothetical protein P8L18_11825 [Verrucomicrobiota bacterium]|nr:hypothetical protein [Verrucomicrobiota bacterium]
MIKQQIPTGTWSTSLSFCFSLLLAHGQEPDREAARETQEEAGKPLIAAAAPPKGGDMLKLINGDHLAGLLQSFHYPGNTVWHRSDIEEPFEFKSESVNEILLGDRVKTKPYTPERITLRLNNGDLFSGTWESLNEDFLSVNTPFAGQLNIPRNRWQWTVFHHADATYLYEGPSGMDGWTVGEVNTAELEGGEWAYRNGAFYALKAASIARPIGMPDRMRLEFDMEWKGSLNLAVALYTDYLQPVSLAEKDAEPDFGGFYSLQLTSYAVNVLMVKQKQPLQYLGMTQTPVFRQATKAHVDVRTNKADNSISLLVNGKMVKRWVDRGGFAGEGKGIRLVHQGQGALRLSNLRIQAWDGRFETPPSNRPQATKDLLTMRNGDKLVGMLTGSVEEKIQFKIGETTTEIAFDKVEKVELGGVPEALNPLRQGEVKANLTGGGTLQFLVESIQGDTMQGKSEVYGPVSMHLPAFERLDFQRVSSTEKP